MRVKCPECVAYTDGDRVRVVDAQTGSEVRVLGELADMECLSAGGGRVAWWDAGRQRAVVVDTSTLAWMLVPGLQWPAPVLDGGALVCSPRGSECIEWLDLATSRVLRRHRLPGRPSALAAGGGTVAVAVEGGPVHVLDAWGLQQVLDFRPDEPRGLAAGAGVVVAATGEDAVVWLTGPRCGRTERGWSGIDPSTLAACPGSHVFASADWQGRVETHGALAARLHAGRLEAGARVRGLAVAATPAGNVVVVAGGGVLTCMEWGETNWPHWRVRWHKTCRHATTVTWCARPDPRLVEIDGYLVHV